MKAFVHRLFNKAKLYGMVEFHENPIELVEVRGISKRSVKPVSLTIEQFFQIVRLVPKQYSDMLIVDQCTGLRAGELLALRCDVVDFERLCIKVKEGVVNGPIGPVKTEYSEDELPLDPDFATVLLEIKRKSNGSDLLFPSSVTGLSYHASPIQQDYIRRAGWCLFVLFVARLLGRHAPKWNEGEESVMSFRSTTNDANLRLRTISAVWDGKPFATRIGLCSALPIPRLTFSRSCFVTPTFRPRSSMAGRRWRISGERTAKS